VIRQLQKETKARRHLEFPGDKFYLLFLLYETPRNFTFRQAVLFLDIINRTELLEGETVVNTQWRTQKISEGGQVSSQSGDVTNQL